MTHRCLSRAPRLREEKARTDAENGDGKSGGLVEARRAGRWQLSCKTTDGRARGQCPLTLALSLKRDDDKCSGEKLGKDSHGELFKELRAFS